MSQSIAEAFEDGLDLQIGLVQTIPQDSRSAWLGYPFPSLAPLGEEEMRTFRTIILENPFLRVTILPGMGGRIISLFDKRTGTEILKRHPSIVPLAGSRRGVTVREGIQLILDGEERLNALGNVSSQIEVSGDEESEAAVWLSETFTGTGISFHLRISIPPDQAVVQIEARVLNRWLKPQPYNAGLSIYLGDGAFDGQTFYSTDRRAGLGVFATDHVFDGVEHADDRLSFLRFGGVRELAPRQVDNWALTLVPYSGLPSISGSSVDAAASFNDGNLLVQSTQQRLGHKLFLLTKEGNTLEAKVDLYPENLLEIPLDGISPTGLVLKDPAKKELLRLDSLTGWTDTWAAKKFEPTTVVSHIGILNRESSDLELKRATYDVSTRHLAYILLGMKALHEKRPEDAALAFEQSLMYNADDPLAWWTKAVALRLAEGDNQAELLNAHYLAPLEPALRAESFLSQPINLDVDANPLLTSLAENPEEFIEVACLLIEAGLFDQASRWIDEALRHRDLPMLRYLMAYCLIEATRLDAEASDQVRLAGEAPLAPPFPFREVEIHALNALLKAFPNNSRLALLNTLIH